MKLNSLYYGDNLDILRRYIKDESVDLIYLDPPFKSNQDYNVLFSEQDGSRSASQILAFEDTWEWDQASASAYYEIVETGGKVSQVMRSFFNFFGGNDMMAYLSMMAPRLVELRRVLKPTGSIYLHCDPTASHYLKVLMDAVFGPERFLNEIAWKRTTAHNDPKRFGRIGDRLLFYSRSKDKIFNHIGGDYSPEQLSRYKYEDEAGRYRAENLTAPHYSPTRTIEWRGVHPGANRQWRFSIDELERLYAEGKILLRQDNLPRKDGLKEYLHEAEGPILQDIWTDIGMAPTTGERLGYPTQKPVALLDRIIAASSNEGDTVLDPFCGCGASIESAEKLSRTWVGIDITHLAITLIKHRMKTAFSGRSRFQVVGEPVSLPDAEALATENRFQFQCWALGLVGARPADPKRGADQGIDGNLYFHDDNSGATKQIVISVKSGSIPANHVRELRGVMDRENAEMGLLITLEKPSKPMKSEAASAGFYASPFRNTKHPRVQIVTIEELLQGKRLDCPQTDANVTFKKAKLSKPAPLKPGLLIF